MISLNDVLLAMSNIPVDDPIAEIWGRGLQGGYRIIKYTGSLPITITANGDALLDYRIYGASGGVGEPTENLFEVESDMLSSLNWGLNSGGLGEFFINYKLSDAVTQELKKGQHTCSIFRHFTDGYDPKMLVCGFSPTNISSLNYEYRILSNNGITYDRTFDFSEWQDIYLIIGYGNGFRNEVTKQQKIDELFANWGISIVAGSIAPTKYEPYGYKLPMTVSDGNTVQSVPVYIGENQLNSVEGVSDYVDKASGKIVRMIGEYTFTGDESFNKYGNSDVFYTSKTIDPVGITTVNTITMRCNHPTFTAIENKDTRYWLNPEADDICCFLPGGRSQVFFRSTSNFATATECKAYLKAQYDNGTPVKISYWLKTPVEEDPPVPLPEIPTINGETIIDYDGTPKPSQMYIKYKSKG